MMESQLIVWMLLSLLGGTVAFLIFEARTTYLFLTTLMFNIFFALSTWYLWTQFTGGLAIYGWQAIFTPCILSSVAVILLLSWYKAYHPKLVFPKKPVFPVQRGSFAISLVMAFVTVFSLAVTSLPSGEPAPTMTTLGSSAVTTLTSDDVFIVATVSDSTEIKIQSAVVTSMSVRDNPKEGEYLDFKVEFDPDYPYTQPAIKVFVHDANEELIPEINIVSYTTEDGMLEGQIYCDTVGVFTITALAYDEAVSSTMPLASNTHSFTVQGVLSEDEGLNMMYIILLLGSISFFAMLFLIAAVKKYLG